MQGIDFLIAWNLKIIASAQLCSSYQLVNINFSLHSFLPLPRSPFHKGDSVIQVDNVSNRRVNTVYTVLKIASPIYVGWHKNLLGWIMHDANLH